MLTRITALALLLLLVFGNMQAQDWKLKNYSTGYRIFEYNSAGNNPLTIAPLLQDPYAYEAYLNTIDRNSLWGNPGLTQLHTFYIGAEWQNEAPAGRFWKEYTLQAGLLFTGRINLDAGAIGREGWRYSPDTAMIEDKYSLAKSLQFFGAGAGVNRRFRISKRLKFQTGLHAQGSFALVHRFQQRCDSSTYSQREGWKTRTTFLPDLEGKKFFQWQVLLPLGLEYELYRNRVFLRVEVAAGLVGNFYRGKSLADKEAHGAGIFLVYQPG